MVLDKTRSSWAYRNAHIRFTMRGSPQSTSMAAVGPVNPKSYANLQRNAGSCYCTNIYNTESVNHTWCMLTHTARWHASVQASTPGNKQWTKAIWSMDVWSTIRRSADFECLAVLLRTQVTSFVVIAQYHTQDDTTRCSAFCCALINKGDTCSS